MTDEEYSAMLAARAVTAEQEQQTIELVNNIVDYYYKSRSTGNTSAMFGNLRKVYGVRAVKPYYLMSNAESIALTAELVKQHDDIQRHQMITPAQLKNKLTADEIKHPLLIDHYVLVQTYKRLLSIISRRESLIKQIKHKLSDLSDAEDIVHTVDLLHDKCARLEEQNEALKAELAKYVKEDEKPSLFKRIVNVFSTK